MKWVDGLLGLLALAAVGTWLTSSGYIFLLDYVTGPTIAPIHSDATGLVSGIPIQALVQLLALVVPAAAITKTLILLTLLIAGISAARLTNRIAQSPGITLACGLFFMLNPFVFNRIFMGHIYLLFGYALLPCFVLALLRYIQAPSKTYALWISGIATLIILISIHFIILLPLATLLFIAQFRKHISGHLSIQHGAIMLVPPFIACAIIGISAWHSPEWTGHVLPRVPASFFALRPYCSNSLLWDTLTLSANWRTATLTTYPCLITPLVGVAGGILLVVATAGASSFWIAILYILSIGLAVSASYIPGWNPMRDSGKFLGVAVLAQILLIASASVIVQRIMLKKILVWIALICAAIISIATIIALQKSIIPAEYPASWYEWNTVFAQQNKKPIALFLPWHQYMPLDFTANISVSNPAPIFFSNADIISGDNIEIMRDGISIKSISENPRSRAIETMLSSKNDSEFESHFTTLTRQENITHIILAEPAKHTELLHQLSRVQSIVLQSTSDDLAVWEVVSNKKQ